MVSGQEEGMSASPGEKQSTEFKQSKDAMMKRGGARAGAGRKKGQKNKSTLARAVAMQQVAALVSKLYSIRSQATPMPC